MIDVALLIACVALSSALVLAIWRALRGRARGRRAVRRLGLTVLACASLVLPAAWQVSKSPGFQLLGTSVDRVDTGRKLVALTLDDGPTPEFTAEVLSILRQHGARATFFVTGSELERAPELGRAIVRDGHELGNHSYSHTRMIGSSLAFIADELEKTDRLIRAAGHTGPIHVRPPYGKKLLALPYHLRATGRTSVLWDIEPESDPAVAASPEQMVTHVLERVRPGSILLLHVMYPGRETSRRALPGIIMALQARGYEIVPVSELLRPLNGPAPHEASAWRSGSASR
jgi:peptidoglycan/xylan/chitin deacetylase (PgdA/CDA1 family)